MSTYFKLSFSHRLTGSDSHIQSNIVIECMIRFYECSMVSCFLIQAIEFIINHFWEIHTSTTNGSCACAFWLRRPPLLVLIPFLLWGFADSAAGAPWPGTSAMQERPAVQTRFLKWPWRSGILLQYVVFMFLSKHPMQWLFVQVVT